MKVLEWAMRKKGIPEVMARSVISLYKGTKMRVKVDSKLSEEFKVKVEMHSGISSKSLRRLLRARVFGKTKVMVNGDITKDCMSKSNVDPCGVCSLRVKANSLFCVQCGKWIHGRCAIVKRVTPKFLSLHAENEKGILHWKWSRKKHYDVETVRKFTYLDNRVSVGGGCEAAVSTRTRYGWAMARECGEMLYVRCPQWLKWAVYKNYVRPAILYGSEAWCLKVR